MDAHRKRLLLGVRCGLAVLLILAMASALVERSARQSVVFVLDHSLSLRTTGGNALRRRLTRSGKGSVRTSRRARSSWAATVCSWLPGIGIQDRSQRSRQASRTLGEQFSAWSAARIRRLSVGYIPAHRSDQRRRRDEEAWNRPPGRPPSRDHALVRFRWPEISIRTSGSPASRPLSQPSARATVWPGSHRPIFVQRPGRSPPLRERDRSRSPGDRGHRRRIVRAPVHPLPEKRNIYHYRAVLEGFGAKDALVENDEALAVVDVRGNRSSFMWKGKTPRPTSWSMRWRRKGSGCDARSASGIPTQALEIAGYDAIIFSGVPASDIGEARMTAIRDYVGKLGGGFA